jgi:endonuclease YncB( thermonuclease family)
MISLALATMLFAAPPNLTCEDPKEVVKVRATFRYVHDGDTACVTASLPFGVSRDICIRVKGLDCPEINKGLRIKEGLKARDAAETWAAAYPVVYIENTKSRSYKRFVSSICPPGGGQCLTEFMIESGICEVYVKPKRNSQ